MQLLRRIPDVVPDHDAIYMQVQVFKARVSEVLKTIPTKVTDCKGLILAAGKSNRWQASVHDFREHDYYSTLYWRNINANLRSLGLPELDKPSKDPGLHKSCALLDKIPIVQYAFLSYLDYGIRDLLAIVSSDSPAQEQILRYIKLWNTRNILRVNWELIQGDSEIAHSAFVGLAKLSDISGDIIVNYSDIVWEERLLHQLLDYKGADIAILVDTEWRNNYPKRRIWHDELYAELVYGKNGRIERIGEIVNRFENIPEWSMNHNRVEMFEGILQHNCIGEIVGFFKFSPRGRRAFCKMYADILNSVNPNILVAEWKESPISTQELPRLRSNAIPIKKALLGDFLEYLNRQNDDIVIEIVEVKGGWVEIDHWGDICIATERLRYDNPIRLELTRNAGRVT